MGIGTINESSLHAALKKHYAQPGDELEAPVGSFVADIRRGDFLIEIQTASFGAMAKKFDLLLDSFHILLVYPVEVEVRLDRPGKKLRKSPRSSSIASVFEELVSIPTLLDHPNLELDVASVATIHVQKARKKGSYRTVDRRLERVIETRRFAGVHSLATLLPEGLASTFTTADVARLASIPRDLAQRMAYCLRSLGVIEEVGRSRQGIQYRRGAHEDLHPPRLFHDPS